ncbi:MAG: LptF/LptG family permease [Kiritimatiellae bacterium]|nr:LptF/LptG family permease [Kiritimatiellia bacterium]
MKILTRYVLREFLIPLFYCLTGFVSIYVLFDLFGSFSRMRNAHISFGDAVMYFCGYLAPYFHYIVPAALMLATLYTMWSFCRHSEIVAMRASGVSFIAIVKPLLAVSLVMSGLVVYVNEVFVPSRAHWAAQMKTVQFDQEMFDKADNIVFRNAAQSRIWNVNELLDGDGEHLRGVHVSVDRPDGGARLFNVSAERADFLDGEWWFSNPAMQHYDSLGQEIATPVPELDALTLRCFPEFSERPVDFMTQNRPWRFNSVSDRFRYLRTHPNLTAETRRDCVYDTWAQIMSPWACVIITLFAIPAGIASGRQSVFKGILGALAMYFAYYGLTIAMMVVAKNGWFPPIPAAVLPPAAVLAFGVRAFVKQR